MRMLTTLADEGRARRLGDYLVTQKIDNTVEPGSAGWAIWVHDDDHLPRAQQELEAFEARPEDPRYAAAAPAATSIRRQEGRRRRRLAERYVDVRTSWARSGLTRATLTVLLVLGCVIVGLLTRLGADAGGAVAQALYIAPIAPDGQSTTLRPLLSGQVWRLVSSIFIHYGALHLLFNMLWLIDLGGRLESARGTLWFALFVLCTAAISNVAEYLLNIGLNTPGFVDWTSRFELVGGMSGVVYGLFGYAWMRGRRAPWEQLGVAQQTVAIMLIWLVLCMTGIIGPVGNVAHLAGLVVGVIWGALPRRRRA